ncbi:unnamed protein product [Oreochromis niloticus]|nr:unnamed protein product [Mustela putorius furo]
MSPSAVVTEGQRVTLTCSTSCPLTDNTNYIWYLNSRPLTPRENQNKHLILDPVSREDAGSYSCAVKTNKDISSAPKTLTVQSITGTWTPAAAGVSAALLLLILLTVCWCVKKKRTSSQSPGLTKLNSSVLVLCMKTSQHNRNRRMKSTTAGSTSETNMWFLFILPYSQISPDNRSVLIMLLSDSALMEHLVSLQQTQTDLLYCESLREMSWSITAYPIQGCHGRVQPEEVTRNSANLILLTAVTMNDVCIV